MKKTLFTLLIILCSTSLSFAQDKVKVREIGLTTSNLDNFGLTFRKGNEKSVFRFNLLNTSISKDNLPDLQDDELTSSTFGLGLRLGNEWRSPVSEKFELRTGFDLGYLYDQTKVERTDELTQNVNEEVTLRTTEASINFVFGFNFMVSQNFILGGELLPAYTLRNSELTSRQGTVESTEPLEDAISFDLNSSSLNLSFVYRF